MKKHLPFTKAELALWGGSAALVLAAFLLFDRGDGLKLLASLIGVTSLLFNAKGNPIGPGLMVIFSALYGIISWRCAYYGEMATYLGMTAPMSLYALVAWLKNPYGGQRSQVKVRRLPQQEALLLLLLAGAVTAVFYFILKALHTANLIPSTVSVTTSFLAVYLTARRSPAFALCYGANDLILILLWLLATREDLAYLSVVVCFGVFFVNDTYTYFRWRRMEKDQRAGSLSHAKKRQAG